MDKSKLNVLKAGVCFLEVEVRNPVDMQDSGNFTGSGFIISNSGSSRRLVATCAHVAPLSSHAVNLEFNNGFRAKGKVVYTDHCHDLSFIEFFDEQNLVVHQGFEFEKDVNDFELLTLIGGNEGYKSYIANGLVADTHILIDDRNTIGIQTSIPSAGGTSGSPIFNEDGKIVGMHIAATERCGFEMKIDIILDALDRFMMGVDKLESGITFEYENKYKLIQAGLITEEDNLNYFSQHSKILIIKDVDIHYENYSHLLPGDIVLKINNKLISNAFDAEKELNDSPNLVADILVKRNGNLIDKKIKLKNAVDENTATIFQWEDATFQDTNITTRRYYSIKEEGVLLSKYKPGSSFSRVGNSSSKINGGKGALITHVNGIRIKNLSDFRAVLNETRKTSISILYYDYICNLPLKFALCDVSYESFDEQNIIDFIPKEDAA